MTSTRCLFVFILVSLLLALPSRSQIVVDLSQDDTLLPFFKAGLHPRNRKGFEMDYCKLPNQTTIQLKFEGVVLPPIMADWQLSVQQDDKLTDVSAHMNKLLTPAEAKKIAMELSAAMGLDPQEVSNLIDTHPNPQQNPPRYAPKKKIMGSDGIIRITYGFNIAPIPEKPYQIYVAISWERKRNKIRFRHEPIKPPPGYEHLSMAPDPNDPGFTSTLPQVREIVAARKLEDTTIQPHAPEEGERQVSFITWRYLAFGGTLILGVGFLIIRRLRCP